MYIIVAGDGYYGPFKDANAAAKYAIANWTSSTFWRIAKITKP